MTNFLRRILLLPVVLLVLVAATATFGSVGVQIDGRRYGMVCDAATDDAAALRAALTASSTKGHSVFISGSPSGALATCMFLSNVSVPSGTLLRADPGTVVLKAKRGNVSNPLLLLVTGVSDVTVQGLTIDGGGADFGSGNIVNTVYSSANVVFDGVTFQHTRGIGVMFSAAIKNSGVRGSTFNDVGNHWKTTALATDRLQAIAFCCGLTQSNYGNFAIGNSFYDLGLDAISTTEQHNFLASGNRCDIQNGQLLATWSYPQPSNFPGCIYSNRDDSITVVGNVIESASGNGIDLDNTVDRTVSGNYTNHTGAAGIGVYGSGNAVVTGNTVKNARQLAGWPQQGGITFSGVLGKISVAGNVVTDDQGAVSTTCTGTVNSGATSCTAASIAGMATNNLIKIAGAGVASADLTTRLTGFSGTTTITWQTATSTTVVDPAVTGVATSLYGIYGIAAGTFTDLKISPDNALTGNVSAPFGGTILRYR